MTFEIIFVLLALLGMVVALALDKMRPGMVLFSVVVLFLCAGILTPKEMLEGFSNKGMIRVFVSPEHWDRLSKSCFLRARRLCLKPNFACFPLSLLFLLFLITPLLL